MPEKGSPPHLRGKLKLFLMATLLVGITPAPAGKTFEPFAQWLPHQDHPRTCGENRLFYKFYLAVTGSPPHLRGKLLFCFAFCSRLRDHPRTCGENCSQSAMVRVAAGSPPHLRGKLAVSTAPIIPLGITPAPAGKTFKILST